MGVPMAESARQSQLNALVESALAGDDRLRYALEVFRMGQKEYAKALSAFYTTVITSSGKSNPEGTEHAGAERHDRGD